MRTVHILLARWLSRYSIRLRAGRWRDLIPVGARFSATVHTCRRTHPASCKMVSGSFLGVKSRRCVTLTTHPLLVSWSRKSRAIPLFPLWAVRPVHSHSTYTKVHCTFTFTLAVHVLQKVLLIDN